MNRNKPEEFKFQEVRKKQSWKIIIDRNSRLFKFLFVIFTLLVLLYSLSYGLLHPFKGSIFSPQFALILSVIALGLTMFLWGIDKTGFLGKGWISKIVGVVYAVIGIFFVVLGILILGAL